MAKISLNKPTSGYNLAAINQNATDVENELNDKVLYRNNPNGEPNQMNNLLDMNGFAIINVDSLNGVDATELADLATYVATATAAATAASASATDADASEVGALASATAAAGSAATAATYSSMGLGGAAAFDLGSITDTVVIFPTDWGTVI